jgi:hypothetical protein
MRFTILTFKVLAQNGHAEAVCIYGLFIRSAARLCAVCAFKQVYAAGWPLQL